MRKCPDCAEENVNESLFCKHCGRCLLAPDPGRSTTTHTEPHITWERSDFFDDPIVKNSIVARTPRRHQTRLSVMNIWLLLLNLLVIILMSEMVRYIVIG
jgi:hypothetical protein